ncbi:UDP-glucose 4-epimerase [Megasphaera sp. An286]|nr:UDP-glucose 4-epimerase [Megasphaera sp. An286]
MNILITGGAGFIGSHIVRKLLETGNTPIVLDNFSTSALENIPTGVKYYRMDILDKTLQSVLKDEKIDAIVHLAGQTMVDYSLKHPFEDMMQNIEGMVNLLEAARITGVNRVVFSSTAAVYGDVNESDLPIRENHLLQPMSFYGLSKLTEEKYLEMYHKIFGVNYVILRFANVYGERQGIKGEGGVISIFAKCFAENKDITVFGDGKQTRDFIYAGDIADGIYAALQTSNVNTVYNLSTQIEVSLLGIINTCSVILHKEINPHFESERKGDIYRSMLCNRKAKEELFWTPKTNLVTGLERTLIYFLDDNAGALWR